MLFETIDTMFIFLSTDKNSTEKNSTDSPYKTKN